MLLTLYEMLGLLKPPLISTGSRMRSSLTMPASTTGVQLACRRNVAATVAMFTVYVLDSPLYAQSSEATE